MRPNHVPALRSFFLSLYLLFQCFPINACHAFELCECAHFRPVPFNCIMYTGRAFHWNNNSNNLSRKKCQKIRPYTYVYIKHSTQFEWTTMYRRVQKTTNNNFRYLDWKSMIKLLGKEKYKRTQQPDSKDAREKKQTRTQRNVVIFLLCFGHNNNIIYIW